MRQSHDLPLSLLPYAVFCALLGGFGMALFQPVPVTETSDRGSCEHQPEVPLLDRPILHAPPGHQVSSNGCTLTVAVSAPGADSMLQRVAPEKDLPVVKQLRRPETQTVVGVLATLRERRAHI